MPPLRSSLWTVAALLVLSSGCYSPMFNGGYRSPYYGRAYAPYGGGSYGYPVGGYQSLPSNGEYLPSSVGTPTFAPGTNQLTPIPDGANGPNSNAPEYNPPEGSGTRQVPLYPEGSDPNEQPDLVPPAEAPVKESNSEA